MAISVHDEPMLGEALEMVVSPPHLGGSDSDHQDAHTFMGDIDSEDRPSFYRRQFRTIWFAVSFIAFIICISVPMSKDNPKVQRGASVIVLMALWWISEVVPLHVTSLLPLVLFPYMDLVSGNETSMQYFKSLNVVILCGFLMAHCIEYWGLHVRMSLFILRYVGASPGRILAGCMVGIWMMSMWLNNTSSTLAMLPIISSIIQMLKRELSDDAVDRCGIAFLLGMCYASSLGGMCTPVGTSPNLIVIALFQDMFPKGPPIQFAQWLGFAVPLSLILLLFTYLVIYLKYLRSWKPEPRPNSTPEDDHPLERVRNHIKERYESQPGLIRSQYLTLTLFFLLVLLWIFRGDIGNLPGWSKIFVRGAGKEKFIDDGTVAMTIIMCLMLIPSQKKDANGKKLPLLNWQEGAVNPRFEILLLLGGGMALATGLKKSGFTSWLGSGMDPLKDVPIFLASLIMVAAMCGLTEVASNTASAQIWLPIVAEIAKAMQVDPRLLMIPLTLAASCAFMLPVATPPNTIVYGCGIINCEVIAFHMRTTGIFLNIISILMITVYSFSVLPAVLDTSYTLPSWAASVNSTLAPTNMTNITLP
eukprot:gene5703-2470_t